MKALRLAVDAYTPDALVAAGVPAATVRKLVADGPRAVPERARLATTGRGRTSEPTRHYVWGPDAMALLAEPAQSGDSISARAAQ